MPSTTHPDAFHFGTPAQSYWEASADPIGIETPALQGSAQCDVAIIGAGYTGLSTALHLRREYGMDVRVLDAAFPGWGASGRNGGFACIGSHKRSYESLIREFGVGETQEFYGAMKDAVTLVEEVCAAEGIDAWINTGGEISLAHLPGRVAALAHERDFMARTFGEKMELLDRAALKERGLSGPQFHGGLSHGTGLSIQPLNYARGLARAAVKAGAVINGHSRVAGWRQEAGRHVLETGNGTLAARHVVVATNGYTLEDAAPQLSGRLMPALSNIIVTRPLSEAERNEQGWTSRLMAYDTRNLLHYFRLLPDGRFLLPGEPESRDVDADCAADARECRRLCRHPP
jgi:glycine/D-amino acid oxidase-like deaminating enzyme